MQIWAFRNGSREGRNLKEYSWAWDILWSMVRGPTTNPLGCIFGLLSIPGLEVHFPACITPDQPSLLNGGWRWTGQLEDLEDASRQQRRGVAVDLMAWAAGSSGSRWRKRRWQRCWEGGDATKSVADGLERANRGRRRQPLPCSGRRRRR